VPYGSEKDEKWFIKEFSRGHSSELDSRCYYLHSERLKVGDR